MIFGSVCSGIEAASVAWEPLGWRACWFAEVDKAASEVLAFRFPDVPNDGDMTLLAAAVRERRTPASDVLVGGTPCQAFSVAGMRQGLADARGQLTLAYVDLADAIDEVRRADGLPPCIIVWENVPGVLSSKDNAFGCFLAGLAGESDALIPAGRKWTNAGVVLGPERAIAWRIIDAQYVGLAQRRRRVFVVAGAGEGFDPAAILLEFDGVRRDSAPRREAGEGVAHPTAPCLTSSGRGVERTGDTRGQDPVLAVALGRSAGLTWPAEIASTLNASFGGKQGLEDQHVNSGCPLFTLSPAPIPPCWDGRDVSQTLDAVLHKGQTMPEKNRFPAVLQPIVVHGTQDPCVAIDRAHTLGRNTGQENAVAYGLTTEQTPKFNEDCALTLTKQSPTGGGQPQCVAYAFQPRIGRNGRGGMGDVVNALTAQAGETGKGDAAPCVAYAFQQNSRDELRMLGGDGQVSGSLCAEPGTRGTTTFLAIPFDTTQITSPGNYSAPRAGDPCHPLAAGAHPPAVCVTGSVTHTLRAEGFDASEDGTGRGQPIVCVDAVSTPLENADTTWAVRRLMPVECEKLQGFPPDWTMVPTGPKRKPAADGPRYKQLGNSMAVNVMRWLGVRIQNYQQSLIGHNGGPSMFDDILG